MCTLLAATSLVALTLTWSPRKFATESGLSMLQTCFWGSTKTGFIPFLTQARTHSAPVPACLAPHMESEIQPSLVVAPAANTATLEKARNAVHRERVRFT